MLRLPRPAATITDNAGKTLYGHNGGVWEWTTSEFIGHDGFVTSELYPGYSSDFFDGKHYVVVRAIASPCQYTKIDMRSLVGRS